MHLLSSVGSFFFKNALSTYLCWVLWDHQALALKGPTTQFGADVRGVKGKRGCDLRGVPWGLVLAARSVLSRASIRWPFWAAKSGEQTRDHKRPCSGHGLCPSSNEPLLTAAETANDTWLLHRNQIRRVKMLVNHCQAHVPVKFKIKSCPVIKEE